MKFQPKRFVVEVKRGTSRASFASPDPIGDRFSSAEAMLFGAGPRQKRGDWPLPVEDAAKGAGRVLRSLVEPPEPVVEELPEPARRGRKPGSKNKPKSPLASAPSIDLPAAVEPPRRGRKPGSKNRPKPGSQEAASALVTSSQDASAAAMRSYGFSEDHAGWREDAASTEALTHAAEAAPPSRDATDEASRIGRPRLRERSAILRRYVLDTEPRPGQPGALRARRAARLAR